MSIMPDGSTLDEWHLSAKNALLSRIEISRMYVDMVCLSCTLRPYHATRAPWCAGETLSSAVPAYDLRALYDHGSGELSPRFDHRFPSFAVTFAIEPAWLSCCRQTHLAVEA